MKNLKPFSSTFKLLTRLLQCLLLAVISWQAIANTELTEATAVLPENREISVYGSVFSDQTAVENTLYTLFSSNVTLNNAEFSSSFAIHDKTLEINRLQLSYFADKYDIKIGQYVTQLGVFDLAAPLNQLNPLRAEYFNDENLYMRRQSTWLGELNIYPNDYSTIKLLVSPYDAKRTSFLDTFTIASLDNAVPYLLNNAATDDVTQRVVDEILLPVYEDSAKPAIYDYIEGKLPEPKFALDTTTAVFNYISYLPEATVGLLYMNAYSAQPIIEIDEDLLTALANIEEENRSEYIADYLAKEDNEPIKSVDYFRYNHLAAYAETNINSIGLRGEIGYRDRFPLINRMTNLVNIGLGIDHAGLVYNNLEIQMAYMPQAHEFAKAAVWQLLSDKYRVGEWQIQFENTATYAAYEGTDISGVIPGLNFNYQDLYLKLKFFHHSKNDFANDFAMLQMKVLF